MRKQLFGYGGLALVRRVCFGTAIVVLTSGPAAALQDFVVQGYIQAGAAQVSLDNRILEASDNFQDDIGVDWDVSGKVSPVGPSVDIWARLNESAPNQQLQGHGLITFETRIMPNAIVAPDGSALPTLVPIGLSLSLFPSIKLDGSISLGTALTASARIVTDPKLNLPELSVATGVSFVGTQCATTIRAFESACGGQTTVYGRDAQAGVVNLITVESFISGVLTGPTGATVRAFADPILMVDPTATFGAGFRYADFFDVEVSPNVTMAVPEPNLGAMLGIAGLVWALRQGARRRA